MLKVVRGGITYVMTAHSYEELPHNPHEEIERAQDALRKANLRWGMEIGVYGPEVHTEGARAQAAVEEADLAGRALGKLLDARPHPSFFAPMSPKAVVRAFGKILGL